MIDTQAADAARLAIVVKALSHRYRNSSVSDAALSDVSLEVSAGSVHALVGPNGAGKTTLCKILSTLVPISEGEASICGFSVRTEPNSVRREIFLALGGEAGLYPKLTVEDNLRLWVRLSGVSKRIAVARVTDAIELVGLGDKTRTAVNKLSRGMKQRVHLAAAFASSARVLILDEPCIGLDPVSAAEVRRIVADLAGSGRTVLLTTHDMREAEELSRAVSIMRAGRILTTASPHELVRRSERVEVSFGIDEQDYRYIIEPAFPQLDRGHLNGTIVSCAGWLDAKTELWQLLKTLTTLEVVDLVVRPHDLETIYITTVTEA